MIKVEKGASYLLPTLDLPTFIHQEPNEGLGIL